MLVIISLSQATDHKGTQYYSVIFKPVIF